MSPSGPTPSEVAADRYATVLRLTVEDSEEHATVATPCSSSTADLRVRSGTIRPYRQLAWT